jgi:hypothetical protein
MFKKEVVAHPIKPTERKEKNSSCRCRVNRTLPNAGRRWFCSFKSFSRIAALADHQGRHIVHFLAGTISRGYGVCSSPHTSHRAFEKTAISESLAYCLETLVFTQQIESRFDPEPVKPSFFDVSGLFEVGEAFPYLSESE